MRACEDSMAAVLPPERAEKARRALARQRAKAWARLIDEALRQPGVAEEFEEWKAARGKPASTPAQPECTPRGA